MALQAAAIETKDALEAIELFYQKGWTDGLPIIPPTERLIQAMFLYEKAARPLTDLKKGG